MFGKVLLLALVCVAATEIVDDNLGTTIEEGLKEIKIIHDRTVWSLHTALDVYYDNDQAIRDTVMEQFKVFESISEKNVEVVTDSSQKLVHFATQTKAKKEVFVCISTRTDKTIQDLRNVVSNFDETITQTGNIKREELFTLSYGLFKIRASLFFNDNYFDTAQEIKGCTTPECVQEIVERYTEENERISADIKSFAPKLNASLEKSKRDIKNTLITGKKDINKAKEAGLKSMKSCFLKPN